MILFIDEREPALWSECLRIKDATSLSITMVKKVLELGDMLVQTDDGKDVLLIERKSFADLCSSIKDGRYEEQSYRLVHSSNLPSHSIIYVIEGMFSQMRNPSDKKIILSAMTSLNVYKGFSTHRTSSVAETAEWLMSLVDKVDREIKKGKFPPILSNSSTTVNATEDPKPYCSVVKKVKKENITPANIGEIVLCQIPNISSIQAVAIMKKFSSFPNMMEELRTNPSCLDNLTYEQNGKARKVNKNCIESIRQFLC
uniref:ERCC4 domain-containing protein n=1 Tax=viral metagenome TaxID=1070528 RepID=A0A6C0I5L0_9ZZZZ